MYFCHIFNSNFNMFGDTVDDIRASTAAGIVGVGVSLAAMAVAGMGQSI